MHLPRLISISTVHTIHFAKAFATLVPNTWMHGKEHVLVGFFFCMLLSPCSPVPNSVVISESEAYAFMCEVELSHVMVQ